MDWKKGLALVYAAIGILAFGHSSAEAVKDCRDSAIYDFCTMDAPIGGLFAGVFWPMYASWLVFED